MQIHTLYPGSWLSNCYIIVAQGEDGKNHAAVIDPSAPADEILSLLEGEEAVLDMIIMTHGHFDHIMSLDELRDATGAPAYIHENDAEMLTDSTKNAYSFFFCDEFTQGQADKTLADGDIIKIGNESLTVIHLPGHSRGSIALMGENILITGDTLFSEGFGRYDLHGGDAAILKNSLNKLRALNGDLKIYPGHGPSSRLDSALKAISYFL